MKTWKPCTVRGCTDRHLARGMCASHYQRWKRTGVLEAFVVVDPQDRASPPAWWESRTTAPPWSSGSGGTARRRRGKT